MSYWQVLVVSLIQGITEFLPVSSSAHLILLPKLIGWQDQGITVDIAVHFGTLIAVCYYFRKEILSMLRQWIAHPIPSYQNEQSWMVWKIIVATCPIVVAGYMVKDMIDALRHPMYIAFGMIFFALFLWHADRYSDLKVKNAHINEYQLNMKKALLIGLAQVLAIIPGASRSGVTITAALYLGVDRSSAARFSFLLSIPTILIGFIWQCVKLIKNDVNIDLTLLSMAIALSAFFAWLTIRLFLTIIQKINHDVFVLYRIVLGMVILIMFV